MKIRDAISKELIYQIARIWSERAKKINLKYEHTESFNKALKIELELWRRHFRIIEVGIEVFNQNFPLITKTRIRNRKFIFTTEDYQDCPIALVSEEGFVLIREKTERDFYSRNGVSIRISQDQLKQFKVIMPGESIPEEPKKIITKVIIKTEFKKRPEDPYGDLQYEI